MAKEKEFNLWKAIKVGSNKKHFTTIHVSRFQISFFDKYFGLEI